DGNYSVEVTHNTEDCEIISSELFVDVTILNLNIKEWNLTCENDRVYFDLTWFNDSPMNRIVIQVSSDNRNWMNLQELKINPEQKNWRSDFPRSGEAYIRVMSEDMYGNLFFSPVKFLDCPLDGITIFPSPAKQSIIISSLN